MLFIPILILGLKDISSALVVAIQVGLSATIAALVIRAVGMFIARRFFGVGI
jgi:hypothetical protein